MGYVMSSREQEFDWEFYISLYPDLREAGINTKEAALSHWKKYGRSEQRAHNRIAMRKRYALSLANSRRIKVSQNVIGQPQQLINVLVRTSSRPAYFKRCIESVLGQNHANVRIIVSYDTESSLDYLNEYPGIEKFFVQVDSREKYRFNLYCNSLMDKVEDGWIVFLDDDDMLVHPYVLTIINRGLENEDTFLFWKFLRPDKTIFPKDSNNPHLGEISTSNFCFHSSRRNSVCWDDQQYGDWNFVSKLLRVHDFTRRTIPLVLTSTSSDDKIGNFGEG